MDVAARYAKAEDHAESYRRGEDSKLGDVQRAVLFLQRGRDGLSSAADYLQAAQATAWQKKVDSPATW